MVKHQRVLSQRKLEIVTKSRRTLSIMAFILLLKFPDLAIIDPGQQNVVSCEKLVIS
jgi:hypothetical protein